jgi:hypothetical protein
MSNESHRPWDEMRETGRVFTGPKGTIFSRFVDPRGDVLLTTPAGHRLWVRGEDLIAFAETAGGVESPGASSEALTDTLFERVKASLKHGELREIIRQGGR